MTRRNTSATRFGRDGDSHTSTMPEEITRWTDAASAAHDEGNVVSLGTWSDRMSALQTEAGHSSRFATSTSKNPPGCVCSNLFW